MIFLLYRFLWWALLPVIVILRFIKDWRSPLGLRRFSHRFGLQKLPNVDYLVHAVSLGEVRAVTPLVKRLLKEFPESRILLTATTLTGSEQIEKSFAEEIALGNVVHTYLPLDNGFMVSRFLSKTAPKAVLIMETEIWPNLIYQAQRRKIPFLIISACLSERSFQGYQRVSRTIHRLLQEVQVLAQTEEDADRFRKLGVKSASHMGNIKYELSLPATLEGELALLNERRKEAEARGISKIFWIVASTHEGEEALVIDTFITAKQSCPDLHLILAPRHPERFATVGSLLAEKLGASGDHFSFSQMVDLRSETALKDLSFSKDIWLIDTLGELLLFYAFSDITTVAGSFVPIGGHNILEPAFFSKPIIVGPYMDENQETLEDFIVQEAIMQVKSEELTSVLLLLADNPQKRAKLGRNARAWMMQNQTGSRKVVTALRKLS